MNFEDTKLTLRQPGTITEQRKPKCGYIDPDIDSTNDYGNSTCDALVGWPPVRKAWIDYQIINMRSCKYVKVAVDGAAYLRKLDLQMFESYEELFRAFEQMFTFLTISRSNSLEEVKTNAIEMMNKGRDEYVVTYQDKDGDWMLVGDVPWIMFTESCNRIHVMRGKTAMGLGYIRCELKAQA